MSRGDKFSARYGQPLAGALLVVAMATVLGLSGEALFGEANLVRKYTIDVIDGKLTDMKDAQTRCVLKGAKLPLGNSRLKNDEIQKALEDYCAQNDCRYLPYVMLGGSLSYDNCWRNRECLWCWDYGERNCDEKKDFAFAKGLSSEYGHRSLNGAYLQWVKDNRGQQPFPGKNGPYVVYSYQYRGWTGHNIDPVHHLMCVKEEENSTSKPTLEAEKSKDPWLSPMWIGIIAGGALLVVVILIIVGICCCRTSPRIFFLNPSGVMGSQCASMGSMASSMGSMGSMTSMGGMGSMGGNCGNMGGMGSCCSSMGSRGSMGIVGIM